MSRRCWILFIINVGLSLASYAQINDRPQWPTFDYLTIDLTTGHPTLYWTPPVHDNKYPDPVGYIIYRKNIDPLNLDHAIAIDSVLLGNITSYTDNLADGNKERLIYGIASKGPTYPSQRTSDHANIFVTSFYDSCNHKIDLSWTNYLGWGNRIEKYDVYISHNPPPAPFTLYKSIPGTDNNVSILNTIENKDYYVYVEAKKQNSTLITRSNLYYKRTNMPVHPASMFVDSIIAEDKRVNIYFKIDPNSGLNEYQVVRWENPDSVKSIFTKKILHTFSSPLKTLYADTVDSWAARTRPFYYKIDALNTCHKIVKVTNHANSITPKVVPEKGMQNRIKWDALYVDTAIHERKSNSVKYRVTRYAYKGDREEIKYLPETDQTEQIDDVQELKGEGYSIKFCYLIEAFERNTFGQITMFSQSRIQCVEIIPGVTMPDAIVPTSSTSGFGNSRNILAPVITFEADYTLSVYNRWGNLIFSGENKGWDGYLNGQLAKEGTYIYRLVVHTLGNRDVIKEGSFVVINK